MIETEVREGRAKPIIGVLLVLGALPLLALLIRLGFRVPALLNGTLYDWALALFVLVWATKVEKRDLASLGIGRPTLASLGWGLLGVVAMFAALAIYYRIVAPLLGLAAPAPAAYHQLTSMPLARIVLLCACAGLC
jgi:membrane protease YdiL (CAAX protease family)